MLTKVSTLILVYKHLSPASRPNKTLRGYQPTNMDAGSGICVPAHFCACGTSSSSCLTSRLRVSVRGAVYVSSNAETHNFTPIIMHRIVNSMLLTSYRPSAGLKMNSPATPDFAFKSAVLVDRSGICALRARKSDNGIMPVAPRATHRMAHDECQNTPLASGGMSRVLSPSQDAGEVSRMLQSGRSETILSVG